SGGGGTVTAPATAQIAAATGSGTVAVRGLATRSERQPQALGGAPLPGGVTIYETSGNGVQFGTNSTFSVGDFQAAQQGDTVTGTLEVSGFNTGSSSATLRPNGNFTGGTAITDVSGTGGATINEAAGSGAPTGQYNGSTGPATSTALQGVVVAYIDGDDADSDIDLVQIETTSGQAGNVQFDEVGIYYGGVFADQAAVDAVAASVGGGTATYSRTDPGGPDTAGVFVVATSEGSLTGSEFEAYAGDVSIDVNFGTGDVSGRISQVKDAAAGVGVGTLGFDVTLTGATLSGTHFEGGNINIVNAGTNTVTDTMTRSAINGSFMGTDADMISGVFQGNGTLGAGSALTSDLGAAGGDPFFINGRFTADE
ncbi:hypothetical protein, partial [Roseobacter sp. HKCCA0434]|uniref:hypothetical protein n=1 Tax=Roseobacter sp. HKCCA0434 TaxID=3079297 RepID=UPI002905B22B